mgnify:CR=1 FL=1
MLPNISDIVIHVSSEENEAKVGTTRFIRIKKEESKSNVELLLNAIQALHSIVDEYENNQGQ